MGLSVLMMTYPSSEVGDMGQDVIGLKCLYEGHKWDIFSMTRNAMGVYYGIRRHGAKQVVMGNLVTLVEKKKGA